MKKLNKTTSDSVFLRQRAEELLKRKLIISGSSLAEKDVLKLIHELEVHQIELELQNEELVLANEKAVGLAADKYAELYDFAPSGYFTLSRAGEILNLNLCGAQMLGQDRTGLKNSRFEFFVSGDTKFIFKQFLAKVFSSKAKETCELTFNLSPGLPEYLYLTGIAEQNGSQCFVTAIDLTDRKRVEKSLQQSEETYRSLLTNLDAGIVVHAPDTSIILCNKRSTELLGLSEAQMKGKRAIEPEWEFRNENNKSISPEEYPVNRILRTKQALRNLILAAVHPSSRKIVWLTVNGFPALNEQGEITEILISFIDITEKRNAEVALRESNEIFSLFLKHSPIYAFIKQVTPKESRILKASENYMDMIGIRGSDMTGKTMQELFPTEFAEKVTADDWFVFSSGQVLQIDEELNGRSYITIKYPIVQQGVNLLAGYTIDITERRQSEKELHKLSRAVEQSPASIVLTDAAGNIEYANPKALRIAGYELNEIIGKNPRLFSSGETPGSVYKDLWESISSGQEWRGEFHNKKKNGELYWEFALISPIFNEKGKISNYLAVKEDITERKQIVEDLIHAKDQAEESDRLKSAFLANMSHEIRTPMNGILGFAELLKEPGLSGEEQKAYISIIEKSGVRMLNIINDIVDISKIESGLMKVSVSEVSVNEQLEFISSLFVKEVEQKGLQFFCKNELLKSEIFILTDREKLYAIFTNLVKNAIKYTTKGSIEIGAGFADKTCRDKAGLVSAEDQVSATTELIFHVKDTGDGIAENRQEAIFERFIQAEISDKMARQGAGLGLSISKAFVEMLGGRIWVESEVGRGSTFYFSIPYQPGVKEKKETEIVSVLPVEENQVNNLKILIVEDDEVNEKLILMIVRKFGKEVLLAVNGLEAIAVCRSNPELDLVLMDIQMPEMNGYEATREIRKFNKEVIIVALTAYALTGDREKAIEAGCNDYIAKPITKTIITKMINYYFKKYKNAQ